jgi:carbamoyl-phosphate synthase small subunit
LTRHLRARGAMKAVLSTEDRNPEALRRKAIEAPGLDCQDLVGRVSCRESYRWSDGRSEAWTTPLAPVDGRRPHVVAYDFGLKRNILHLLHDSGFRVTVVPARHAAGDTLALEPDAVFLSNGPGDPEAATDSIREVRALVGRVPMFGICLGHQIAALALGGRTFKLKFGHHGANHPVLDVRTGRVAVTSQNHGYAVVPDSLPSGTRLTHVNLNDDTCEGFVHADARLLAVQYHPESSPGPHDSLGLFREFRELVLGPSGSVPAGEGAR